MTREQYGSGPWLVKIRRDQFSGDYRFETEAEAKAFQRKNGGTLAYRPGKFLPLW